MGVAYDPVGQMGDPLDRGSDWKGPWRQTSKVPDEAGKDELAAYFVMDVSQGALVMVSQRLTRTVTTGMSIPMLPVMATILSHVGAGVWRRWCVPM